MGLSCIVLYSGVLGRVVLLEERRERCAVARRKYVMLCYVMSDRHYAAYYFLFPRAGAARGQKKRRRGARAREVRERARSRVTILTVSRSCIGGATRENVVGGAGPGPSELSVCLSV